MKINEKKRLSDMNRLSPLYEAESCRGSVYPEMKNKEGRRDE